MNDFLIRWKPAVPRHWLLVITGTLWSLVGMFLVYRALSWLVGFELITIVLMAGTGIVIAAIGYRFGFSKVVEKNIARIHVLPERACVFGFTAWRGYGMIGVMITTGILLRNTDLPKHYLSIPYMAMGGSLVLASVQFIRQFIQVISITKD